MGLADFCIDGDGFPDSVDECPRSALAPTVGIAGRDSGVTNHPFGDGCTRTDRVLECGHGSQSHGGVAPDSAQLLGELHAAGRLTGTETDAIQRCVARTR